MNPNNLVCRTCLGIISKGKVSHNIDEENGLIQNVQNIREMIMFCIPEMDVYISISPVICESCIGTLVSVYNFKIRCLRVENAIRSYIMANNVMEGSCVNLNNVVRQQIVEALKQKNWAPEIINEYVDKHLCTTKVPENRSSTDILQARARKLPEPQAVNTTTQRPLILNTFVSVPSMNLMANILPGNNGPPPPYGATVGSRPPPHFVSQGGGYISVSKNLMPPRTEQPSQPPQLGWVTTQNPVDLTSLPPPAAPPGAPHQSSLPLTYPSMGDFQNAFLSALQLTSSANGGREEAVLVKKKEEKRRAPKKPKRTQNYIPQAEQLTGLRKVRKSKALHVGNRKKNNNDTGYLTNGDIITLDDDVEVATQKVGDELLMMNFEESEDVLVKCDVQGTPNTTNKKTPSKPSNTPDFTKKILVKLPMIDKDTLKRKLTPENIIDEIQSKRRKLVVKLSSRLPYLHKTKRLMVKMRRETFLSCLFCKSTVMSEKRLREHYLKSHRVCMRCHYKCDRPVTLNRHINVEHPYDLKEALKRYENSKTEFHCFLCNFTGLSGFDLRDHRLRIHVKCNSMGMYKCPYLTCDTEHAIAYEMNKHIEKYHDKLRQTTCPLCNYVAVSRYILQKHVESHCMTKMKCQYCDFICKTSFSLKMHEKKRHPKTHGESSTGMVYTTDLPDDTQNVACSDDYRVTLRTLLSQPLEPRSSKPTKSTSKDKRSLDQYDFALPSLTEMLCSQNFTEEPSDQEGDCTIVSEDVAKPQKRPRLKKTPIKTTKKPQKNAVDDPDDCMIVLQDIPTVDLSDDEDDDNESESNAKQKRKETQDSSELGSAADVIEILDQEDTVVVSDVAPSTESSAQESAKISDDSIALSHPGGSETDTCSEISVATTIKATQEAVVDTCPEVSGGDVLSQKARSKDVENLDEVTSESESSENVRSLGGAQYDATNKASERVIESDTPTEPNISEEDPQSDETPVLEKDSDQNKSSSLEGDQARSSNQTESSKDNQHVKDKSTSDNDAGSSEKSDQNCDKELDRAESLEELLDYRLKVLDLENTRESRGELFISAPTTVESVLVESSDEDSNDCTFVSETIVQEEVNAKNKEKESNGDQEAVNEEAVPESSKRGDNKDSLEESQEKLEKEMTVEEATDAAETAQACRTLLEIYDKSTEVFEKESESELLNTDSEIESEKADIWEKSKADSQANISDILNTISEIESADVELSESIQGGPGKENTEAKRNSEDTLKTSDAASVDDPSKVSEDSGSSDTENAHKIADSELPESRDQEKTTENVAADSELLKCREPEKTSENVAIDSELPECREQEKTSENVAADFESLKCREQEKTSENVAIDSELPECREQEKTSENVAADFELLECREQEKTSENVAADSDLLECREQEKTSENVGIDSELLECREPEKTSENVAADSELLESREPEETSENVAIDSELLESREQEKTSENVAADSELLECSELEITSENVAADSDLLECREQEKTSENVGIDSELLECREPEKTLENVAADSELLESREPEETSENVAIDSELLESREQEKTSENVAIDSELLESREPEKTSENVAADSELLECREPEETSENVAIDSELLESREQEKTSENVAADSELLECSELEITSEHVAADSELLESREPERNVSEQIASCDVPVFQEPFEDKSNEKLLDAE